MDREQVQQIAIYSALAVFFVAATAFFVQNQSLSKKNKELTSSMKKLQKTFDELEDRNKELLAKIEENSASGQNFEQSNKELKDSLDALKKENESIQYDLKKAKTEAEQAAEEKTYLEDMLIRKTKEIESLKKGQPPAAAAAPQAPAFSPAASGLSTDEIAEKIRQKDAEIQRLSDQNKILSERLDRLYKVTNEKISEINVAKIALEDTVSGARKKIEEEWNTVNLGSITVDKQGASPSPAATTRSGPKQEGHILAINESHGFVVVDLGKVDNMTSGTELSVLRDGRSIGELSVLEVRDVMTACNIKHLEDGEKIQVNDLALRKS